MIVRLLKQTGIAVFCLLISQGCLLKKRIDSSIAAYYGKRSYYLNTYANPSLKLNTDSLTLMPGYSKSRYNSFFTVPLLFYYYSNEKIRCDVNPLLLINSVMSRLGAMSETEFPHLFEGRELELCFKKVPTTLYYKYKSHVLLSPFPPIFSLFRSSKKELYSAAADVVLSYTVRDKNSGLVTKQGEIRHQIRGNYRKQINENRVEFIENFYKFYDDELLTSGNEIATSIVKELLPSL